jgi:hypothetical protein
VNKDDTNKELLKSTVLKTKKVNKKLRKRNKNKVSTDEFNDVKNMTVALEDVLNQLKET